MCKLALPRSSSLFRFVISFAAVASCVCVPGAVAGSAGKAAGAHQQASHASSALITPGGPSVVVTIANAGDTATLSFDGTAGQRVSLNMTNSTIGNFTTVSIRNPSGATIRSGYGIGFYLDTISLSVTGTYSIVVDPNGTLTGQITATLYNVPADFSGTISPGGSPVTVVTTVPGQNGTLTFSGAAGQRVSLNLTNSTIGNFTTVSIWNPNGARIKNGWGISFFEDTVLLLVTGTYRIFFDPNGTLTGQITATLYNVPPDFSGTISPGGSPVTVVTTVPGQNGQLSFYGMTGQSVSVNMTNSTIGNFTTVTIRSPSGATVKSGSGIGFSVGPAALSATGLYSIVIDPNGTLTGQITVTLTGRPSFSGVITISGEPFVGNTLTITQSGSWFGTTSLSQQWYRCDETLTCYAISGATAAAYVPSEGDIGWRLKATQTGTNQYGATTADSALTEPVVSYGPLLQQFAPELRFPYEETYRADSAGIATDLWFPDPLGWNRHTNFLDRPDVNGGGYAVAAADWSTALLDLSLTFLSTQAQPGDFLNQPNFYGGDGRQSAATDYEDWVAQNPLYRRLTYGRIVPDPSGSGQKILQYWLFYYYNPKDPLGYGNHEGDWELVQVRLSADNVPISVALSQHRNAERCDWGPSVGVSSTGHPVVYVAYESHANYFWPGHHEAPVSLDFTSDDGALYREVPNLEEVAQDRPGWILWDGRWGDSTYPYVESPRSPGQQSAWQDPWAWHSNAGSCTQPPVLPLRRRGAESGVDRQSAPELPDIVEARVVKDRFGRRAVRVSYCFPSLPSDPSAKPSQLHLTVENLGDMLPPLSIGWLVQKQCGTFVHPVGPIDPPYLLRYFAQSRPGTRSQRAQIPVRDR